MQTTQNTQDIFQQKPSVISTFIVPYILGHGSKSPDEAKSYIKNGQTLNPSYYSHNNNVIDTNGSDYVYNQIMNTLFDSNKIDLELSEIIGSDVYKPWDCLSGIFQIEINQNMGLIARPAGVTLNNKHVIMIDDYYDFYNRTIEKRLKSMLLATMAVWKAERETIIMKKINKIISIEFNQNEWNNILNKIKLWAE